MRQIPYPHPGEILLREFLRTHGHHPVPAGQGDRRVAAAHWRNHRRHSRDHVDTGLRLSRFFGTSEGFWTGLQLDHDAAKARDELAETLDRIRPWPTAA